MKHHHYWEWTWRWTVPTHAHFGDNPLFDWIRVVCVVVSVILGMLILRTIVEQYRRQHQMPTDQIARYLSLLLADISIGLTEAAVVGTPATPRLIVNLIAVSAGCWGVWRERRRQSMTPVVYDKPQLRKRPPL